MPVTTPLEWDVLAAIHGRRQWRVHELAAAIRRDVRGTETALRLLERRGLVVRAEDGGHVVVWRPVGEPGDDRDRLAREEEVCAAANR